MNEKRTLKLCLYYFNLNIQKLYKIGNKLKLQNINKIARIENNQDFFFRAHVNFDESEASIHNWKSAFTIFVVQLAPIASKLYAIVKWCDFGNEIYQCFFKQFMGAWVCECVNVSSKFVGGHLQTMLSKLISQFDAKNICTVEMV